MRVDFTEELAKLKESETSQGYELKENEWENERKLLMNLIEKNQKYAYNAQEKLKEEKQQFESELTQSKQQFAEKIEEIEIENTKLKDLLDKVQNSEEEKGDEVKMVRANLIEEIFRVQNVHQKNEDELRKDNDLISQKYSQGIQSFKETLKQAEEDNNMLRKKINSIVEENKKSETDLIYQINELNRANSKLTKLVEQKHQEFLQKSKTEDTLRKSEMFTTYSEKDSVENFDSSIGQLIASSNKTVEAYEKQLKEKTNKWKKEKQKLLEEIESRETLYAEKLALKDMEFDRIKSTFDRQRKLEDTKNQTLMKENKILDRSLKDINKKLKEKMKQAKSPGPNKEILQSKLDQHQKREDLLKSEIDDLRKDLIDLQTSYQKREETYILESKTYLDQIESANEKSFEMLKPIQRIDNNYYTSDKLKKEITNLRKQIEIKDQIINDLKDIENMDKRKQRKDIQHIMAKFRETIDSYQTQIEKFNKDQPSINQIVLELNTKHNKVEQELLDQLTQAKEEIFKMKENQRNLKAENTQEIVDELENKLVVSNNELDHAKRNLIQYITSLNELEDLIKDNQSITIGENEEVQRLRFENERLNEENSSLIESKKEMDEYHQGQIENLRRENQALKGDITNLEREYDKLSLKITTVHKNLEIWRDREQTIRENYDKIEQKLKSALSLKKKSKEFSKSESVLKQEEDTSFKEEHKKMEKLLKLSQEKWNEEKATLNEEIFHLRARLTHCEESFVDITEKLVEEHKTIKETRLAITNQSEQLKSRIIETESLLTALKQERETSKNQESTKDQELVLALGDDIAFLKNKLTEEQNLHDADLKLLQKNYDEKLSAQSLREQVLHEQIEELKVELSETEQAFESYKYLNQKENANLTSEINQLRRHSNVRQDQVHRRENKLKEEIERLKRTLEDSITIQQSESMKVDSQKQINKLNQELGKKARILQETKRKLRKEQLRIAEMTKRMKSFDLKSIKSDFIYLKEIQNAQSTSLIDEKVALSSLVNKLQQYVFDIEQTALKEELGIENTLGAPMENYGYTAEDINFKSPVKQLDSPEFYPEINDDDEEESDTLYLGNTRELEERLQEFRNIKENARELETSLKQGDKSPSPLSDNTSSVNQNSSGSYAQKYMKKKKTKKSKVHS